MMMSFLIRLRFVVFYLLVVGLSACETLDRQGTLDRQPSYDIKADINLPKSSSSVKVKKSNFDPKSYRYLKLKNGLQVLLIHDPKAQKAAVSLDVNVGSGADPKGREGLAHFLEHMLFLGTQKYPQAGEYQAFIQRHGGSYNAYTSYNHTNYFFDIQTAQFEQAFDRFAQFFIAPLFLADLVERERQAVFSEYAARLKDEGRRSLDALKAVVNQDHPFAKFSVGSNKTLSTKGVTGSQLRDDVIDFYKTYYSADVMALVVAANNSLDELEALVVGKMSKIPNVEVPAWQASGSLFAAGSLPALLQIQPEKTLKRLKLSFPIPSAKAYYKSKPLSYLSHILGHEGQGSLLSELKRLGLATAISAGSGFSFADEEIFSVTIGLTEQGEKRWKQVVELVFSAIGRIKSAPLHPELYQDLAKLADLEYRFKDNRATLNQVMYYAANLHDYAPEDVIAGPYLHNRYDEKLIEQFLGYLNPSNMLITLTSKQVDTDQVSPWFYAPYRFSQLSEAWVHGLAQARLNANIVIPKVNPFLPDDLTLIDAENDWDKPSLIIDQAGMRFWHKQDTVFKKPKTQWVFNLNSRSVSGSPDSYAANILHASMLNDSVTELSYPALMAGLRFSISAQKLGLSFRLSGYSDKQPKLILKLLGIIDQGLQDQSRFESLRAELMHYYQNQSQSAPYKVALRAITDQLLTPAYSPQIIADALGQLTWGDFKQFTALFWHNFEVEGLVNGNTTELQAKSILAEAAPILASKIKGDVEPVMPVTVATLSGGQPIDLEIQSSHQDHAAVIYYQFPVGVDGLALSSVSAKMLETRFYHKLRTLDQLGYVVFATPFNIKEQGGIAFVVQSPKVSPKQLVQSIQAFLSGFISEQLTDIAGERPKLQKEFLDAKASLKHELQIPAKNLREQTGRYWYDIANKRWQFDSREQLLHALEQLTFEQWSKSLKRYLQHQPRIIRSLSTP